MDKRKEASTVGPNRVNKQGNRKRKGDGSTTKRRPNINAINGISRRASSKGHGNRHEKRKRDGHKVSNASQQRTNRQVLGATNNGKTDQ